MCSVDQKRSVPVRSGFFRPFVQREHIHQQIQGCFRGNLPDIIETRLKKEGRIDGVSKREII